MALIAPSKISPKGDYLYVECFTTTGNQARTINQPIIWPKSWGLLATIPFAYGIDNRYFDGSHVHIKEISLKYFKHVKSNFDNGSRESLTTYQGSMFDVAVEQVTLKVNLGSDDPESDDISYGISLGLPWSDFETILPDLWKGCVDEWDKQLVREYEVKQLSMFEDGSADQLKMAVKFERDRRGLEIAAEGTAPIDIAAYSYPEDQLVGRRGPLTGSTLDARKLKLIRDKIAVPINDNSDDSRPFGFDPSA
jgi:hypothetical protein